jgi:hypothetical protein
MALPANSISISVTNFEQYSLKLVQVVYSTFLVL